jgi:hypothetical protein
MDKKDIISSLECCLVAQKETLSKVRRNDLVEIGYFANPPVRVLKVLIVMDKLIFNSEAILRNDRDTWQRIKRNLLNPMDYL